ANFRARIGRLRRGDQRLQRAEQRGHELQLRLLAAAAGHRAPDFAEPRRARGAVKVDTLRRLLLPLLAGVVTGCDDPLAYPQDIDHLRVLGATVAPSGDARRAWALPEESVSLTWLV